MKKYKGVISIGVICFLLTIAISIQMKTIEEAKSSVGTTLSDNSELIDEVFALQDKYDRTYKNLEKAEKDLENIRKQALASQEKEAETELNENNKLLGLTEVSRRRHSYIIR